MAEKENNRKYFNYSHQSARLKQMIDGKCFFEAMVIEDAIIEDRLMSCLRHAFSMDTKELRQEFKLNGLGGKSDAVRKIMAGTLKGKTVKTLPEGLSRCFNEHFDEDLLNRLDTWRQDRNDLTHDLMLREILVSDLKQKVDDGYEIMKAVKSCAGKLIRALDKLKADI
jgi:hypothetical protein